MNCMNKGDRIKYLRETHNMTQTELAKLLNTLKQTIYKYETGIITNIPFDKIEIMANIFNVSPAFIMGWEDTYNVTEFSNHEKQVIAAYRNKPDMQPAVDQILGIKKEIFYNS